MKDEEGVKSRAVLRRWIAVFLISTPLLGMADLFWEFVPDLIWLTIWLMTYRYWERSDEGVSTLALVFLAGGSWWVFAKFFAKLYLL